MGLNMKSYFFSAALAAAVVVATGAAAAVLPTSCPVEYAGGTAPDLVNLKICDEIIPEAAGGAHRDQAVTAAKVRIALKKHLKDLSALPRHELVERRYQKFRAMGAFTETTS